MWHGGYHVSVCLISGTPTKHIKRVGIIICFMFHARKPAGRIAYRRYNNTLTACSLGPRRSSRELERGASVSVSIADAMLASHGPKTCSRVLQCTVMALCDLLCSGERGGVGACGEIWEERSLVRRTPNANPKKQNETTTPASPSEP